MAIVFPASPSNNDTFTVGSITYTYDGSKWIGLGVTPTDRLIEGSNKLEIDASNNLVWTGFSAQFDGANSPAGLDTRISQYGSLLVATTDDIITSARCSIDSGNGNIATEGAVAASSVNLQSAATSSWFQTGTSLNSVSYVWAAKDSSANVWHSGLQTDGDLYLGGNLTSANNIGLKGNDGSGFFLGSLSVGDQLTVGSSSSPTIRINNSDGSISADQTIGVIEFKANDGSGDGSQVTGSIESISQAAFTGQGSPSHLIFKTNGVSGSNALTERFRIKSNGDLKHTGLRIGGGDNKLAILVTPSHNTNEEDVIVYQVENEGSFNQITFGGGTSSYNAATKLSFKTASAVDTTGGTERLSIDSNGIVRSHQTGISGSSLTLDLGSSQVVAGFQAKEISGAAQALTGYWFNHGGLNAGIASTRQVTNQWGTDLRFYTHPFATSDQHKVYERFRIDPDGRIFIRSLLGNASAGSAVKYSNSDDELRYDTSSGLLKTNITECPYGIETVKKLKPSRYTPQEYDKEGNINVTDEVLIGFIAEEMVEEVPEVVQMYPKSTLTRNDEDTEIVPAAISYDKLTAVLTKALQEAIAEIETLKGRLDAAGM